MHDESPGGQAVKDRALAYWTDPGNFPTQRLRSLRRLSGRVPASAKLSNRERFGAGFAVAFIASLMFG